MNMGIKRFVKFIPPIVIPHIPVHGKHAQKNSKPKPKDELKEATEKKSYYGNKLDSGEQDPDHPMNKNYNEHLGKSIDDVHEKLDTPHEVWQAHPTEHKTAIHLYTSGSHDINSHLLTKHLDPHAHGELDLNEKDKAFLDEHKEAPSDGWMKRNRWLRLKRTVKKKEHLSHLDDFLHSKPIDHELHVFHGTKHWHPGQEAAKHPEGHIMLPAYTSTSIDKVSARGFAQMPNDGTHAHMLHIHLKPGDKGHYLGSNSEYADEKEFLLPRKTVLKIHKKPDVYHHQPKHDPDDLEYYEKQGLPVPRLKPKKAFVWHAHIVRQGHPDD
jgi:hypothetical protein